MNRGTQLEWIPGAVEWRGRKAEVRPNLETAVQQLTLAEWHEALQRTELKQLATGLEQFLQALHVGQLTLLCQHLCS